MGRKTPKGHPFYLKGALTLFQGPENLHNLAAILDPPAKSLLPSLVPITVKTFLNGTQIEINPVFSAKLSHF